ncbi:MAG: AAA family ATPase [Pyrinomonadaceae bacterium]
MGAIYEEVPVDTGRTWLDELLPSLQRLDCLLERAVAVAQSVYGQGTITDRFRGLYISDDEVEQLLARTPGSPTLQMEEIEVLGTGTSNSSSRLAWLKQVFGLSSFEIDLILIALAPELDLRYEHLYAYLQDDVTRRRPTMDLALNLLCRSAEEKLARRAHFASEAPLIRQGLMRLVPDPHQAQPPLLAYNLKLDDPITCFLLGQQGFDSRLSSCCQLIAPSVCLAELPLTAGLKQALSFLAKRVQLSESAFRLYFYGPHGAGKRRSAEALAGETATLMLYVDVAQALNAELNFEQFLKLLFREIRFHKALLYLDEVDALRSPERRTEYQQLLTQLAGEECLVILSGTQPWTPSSRAPVGVLAVHFPIPDYAGRLSCWRDHLQAAGIGLEADEINALAECFRLTPAQIADAVATARNNILWRNAAQAVDERLPASVEQPILDDLFNAARAQSGHDLAALAHKLEPAHTWSDIVLPCDSLSQLREMCQWVMHRHRVLDEWGFGRKLSLGKGVNALFAGPSGTGKTMAAEVIANKLGLDLYKIDLSGVVSKYIGETEKNLERIFTAAERANAILFFDEADALFGKRSEVHDAHDRYANIEVAYLLQKMEQHEGMVILATNLRQNMDEAFLRRLAFIINFPFPDAAHRRRIWVGIWPKEMRLAADVDLDFMAREFKLSGGNIKNIALAAAFLAAENGDAVTMPHLIQAARREYEKMGKMMPEDETMAYVN